MKIDELMRMVAERGGACDKAKTVTDWESLARLFFSKQGAEFCFKQRFPSLEIFKALECDLTKFGIYVSKSFFIIILILTCL